MGSIAVFTVTPKIINRRPVWLDGGLVRRVFRHRCSTVDRLDRIRRIVQNDSLSSWLLLLSLSRLGLGKAVDHDFLCLTVHFPDFERIDLFNLQLVQTEICNPFVLLASSLDCVIPDLSSRTEEILTSFLGCIDESSWPSCFSPEEEPGFSRFGITEDCFTGEITRASEKLEDLLDSSDDVALFDEDLEQHLRI